MKGDFWHLGVVLKNGAAVFLSVALLVCKISCTVDRPNVPTKRHACRFFEASLDGICFTLAVAVRRSPLTFCHPASNLVVQANRKVSPSSSPHHPQRLKWRVIYFFSSPASRSNEATVNSTVIPIQNYFHAYLPVVISRLAIGVPTLRIQTHTREMTHVHTHIVFD